MPPIMRIRLSPHHDYAERRDLLADAGDVGHGQEDRAHHRADDQQDDEHGQQRHLAEHADVDAAQAAGEGAPGGRAAAGDLRAGRSAPAA